ncbi:MULTISPECIES: hypothetical protein [Xanthomonas]|uniref:hypothetical protein n=1 Tax=Xanthomonas TaxID=338 RepID=UPI0011B0F178|nr:MULTISPECIES: hypothetical protein [Xanthomonas]MCC8442378.1 hypothetical protein [Xanthomonas cannabis]
MKKSLLVEIVASSLSEARNLFDSSYGILLDAHESEYRGGEYFRCEIDGVVLALQENFLEDDGEKTEAEFPKSEYLLYMDGDDVAVDKVLSRISEGKKILRSSVY